MEGVAAEAMGVRSQASPVLGEPLEKDHVWSIITAGQKTSSTALSMGKTDAPPLPHSMAVPKHCVRKGAGNKKKKKGSPSLGREAIGEKKVEWTMCALIPLPPADDNEADRCCRETDKWTGR